jgi:peroxiredoxin (alkyl hydroperoxide reductase subunit C)
MDPWVDPAYGRSRSHSLNPKEEYEMHLTSPSPESGPALLQLNGPVPDFEAKTTHGTIKLSEWNRDKWVILFSHPADFTPVCTTEFMAFAKLADELEKRDVALLGNSIDSVYSHIAWVRNIKENFGVDIPFPIIADLDQQVARKFGMIHEASSDTAAIRAVFFIDPARKLRAMIYYPLNVGRNFDEVLRVVDALQTTDRHGVACPADWKPGEKVIVPPPGTAPEAEARVQDTSLEVTDWYFSKKMVG